MSVLVISNFVLQLVITIFCFRMIVAGRRRVLCATSACGMIEVVSSTVPIAKENAIALSAFPSGMENSWLFYF